MTFTKVEPRICVSGLTRRQACYHALEMRGIWVDTVKLAAATLKVQEEIEEQLKIAEAQWRKRLYVGTQNSIEEKIKVALKEGKVNKEEAALIIQLQKPRELNIRSPKVFLQFLTDMKYKVPKVTKKDKEGEWSSEESTSELALRQLIRENQLKYPQGDKALIAILNVRELLTLKSRYLDARLFPKEGGEIFLSSYNAGSGTLTGRRSSKKHIYGYGGNAQNIPKHSKTAEMFRECLTARPGTILLSVDQISAEDWPVSALANNTKALDELRTGVDRHAALGAYIFNIPVQQIIDAKARGEDPIERYLGKKTRHANNYGMKAPRMHDSLMQEGKFFSVDACNRMLERANANDPAIKGVFHKYVENEIAQRRILTTPFGRERQFLGFRPNSKNGNLYNEAFAYIPQSLVGDNTGFALEELCLNPEPGIWVLQEGHDSIIQEVTYDPDAFNASVDLLAIALERTIESFKRPINFHNGITVDIPVEAELAWNFKTSVKIKTQDKKGIIDALAKLGPRVG